MTEQLFGGKAEQLFGKPSDESKLGWREHDANQVRVWKDGWAGDSFEILPKRAIADLWLLGYNVRRPLGVCEDDYNEGTVQLNFNQSGLVSVTFSSD